MNAGPTPVRGGRVVRALAVSLLLASTLLAPTAQAQLQQPRLSVGVQTDPDNTLVVGQTGTGNISVSNTSLGGFAEPLAITTIRFNPSRPPPTTTTRWSP